MRSSITHAFAAALVLVPVGIASEQLAVQPQSKMWVEGTSTIRSFQCSVPDFTLAVHADGIGAVGKVLAGAEGGAHGGADRARPRRSTAAAGR